MGAKCLHRKTICQSWQAHSVQVTLDPLQSVSCWPKAYSWAGNSYSGCLSMGVWKITHVIILSGNAKLNLRRNNAVRCLSSTLNLIHLETHRNLVSRWLRFCTYLQGCDHPTGVPNPVLIKGSKYEIPWTFLDSIIVYPWGLTCRLRLIWVPGSGAKNTKRYMNVSIIPESWDLIYCG